MLNGDCCLFFVVCLPFVYLSVVEGRVGLLLARLLLIAGLLLHIEHLACKVLRGKWRGLARSALTRYRAAELKGSAAINFSFV